jgi:hypothetical protein
MIFLPVGRGRITKETLLPVALGFAIAVALGAAAFSAVRLLPRAPAGLVVEAHIAAKLVEVGSTESAVQFGGTGSVPTALDDGRKSARVACGRAPADGGNSGRIRFRTVLLTDEPSIVYLSCPRVVGELLAARLDGTFQSGRASCAQRDASGRRRLQAVCVDPPGSGRGRCHTAPAQSCIHPIHRSEA